MSKQNAITSSFGGVTRNNYRIKLLIAVIVFLLLGIGVAWHWGSFTESLTVEKIAAWASMVKDHPLSLLIVISAYVVASLVLFPITLLIVATAMTFGPLLGFAYATAGYFVAALLTYAIGYFVGHDFVAGLSRSAIGQMSRSLARHGLVAMAAVHLLPVAPFTLVNMAAGAVHVRFRDFVLGTLIGMVPGIAAITIFEQQLEITWRDPRPENFVVLAVLLIAIALGLVWIRTRMGPRDRR
jgi:phospholipase D1/2